MASSVGGSSDSVILHSCLVLLFFLMIRRPPRSTLDRSSAASDVYKRQEGGIGVDQSARFAGWVDAGGYRCRE